MKNVDKIRKFWKKKGNRVDHSASWTDKWMMDLEYRTILKYIEYNDDVLDIGCSNGYTTMKLASSKNMKITGFDYIPEMIENANKLKDTHKSHIKNRVNFICGDIMNINKILGTYDKVILIRVIINLGEFDKQLIAIENALSYLKQGGLLLMSEATIGGLKKLNDMRSKIGLENIGIPWFNNYLDEDIIINSFPRLVDDIKIINFSSTYFFGTRVLKPLLFSKKYTDNPETSWNYIFSKLPSFGGYGTQKLFIIRKR